MKKLFIGLVFVAIMAFILVTAARAVTPYMVTVTNSAKSCAYTNTRDYAVEKLTSIEMFNCDTLSDTITVTRIRSLHTNTIYTTSFGTSDVNRFRFDMTNTQWLFNGDILFFQKQAGTTAVFEITGKVHP